MPVLDQYKTTAQLLLMARKDPDPVSVFLNGDRIETTHEAVLVVKGNTRIRRIMALLTANDLMSSNPVNPPDAVRLDGEQARRSNELLESAAADPDLLESLVRELVWWREGASSSTAAWPSAVSADRRQ